MNFVPPSQFNDFSNGGVGGYPQYEQQLFQQQQQQPQPFHQSEFQQPDFGVGMIPQHDQLQQQQHQQQQHQQQQGLPGMVGAPGLKLVTQGQFILVIYLMILNLMNYLIMFVQE